MFSLFKKKPSGTTTTFKISGMHCTSCSMNIDGELEDIPGVISSTTSYATSKSKVEFDASKVSTQEIKATIQKLGYEVEALLENTD